MVDRLDLLLGQAHGDELGETPIVADHAERPVGRVHQADRGFDEPCQRRLQVQARADRDDRLQEAAQQLHPSLRDLITQTQAAVDSALLSHRV